MEKLCLDTDVLIAYLKENEIVKNLVLDNLEKIVTTSINVYELLFGPLKINREKEFRDAIDSTNRNLTPR